MQELDVLHQSSNEHYRTNSPSSRDSGIPVRSSSSCCSLTSETATSTPKSFLELPQTPSPQTSVLQFFLHPPEDRHRHISVCLTEQPTGMSYVQDSVPPRYQSHGQNIHAAEPSMPSLQSRRSSSYHTFQRDCSTNYYSSEPTMIKKLPQRISLNANLPFQAKLNIHIHADRTHQEQNDPNQVKGAATIGPLESRREPARRTYSTHYSNEEASAQRASINKAERSSSMNQRESRRDKLPRHRQVSLPISLPIDQRLYLYIRNGEVLARC